MQKIRIKKSKQGSLHTALGVPQDKKISTSKLTVHEGDSPALKKKKIFAQNARKWNHADGGLIQPTLGTFNTLLNDNRYNAEVNLGETPNTGEYLGTGEGYQMYAPLGEDYDTYVSNIKNMFDPSDPIKKKKLLDLFDINNPINQTPERKAWLQEIHQKRPGILNDPTELLRLATDRQKGPVHSLISEAPTQNNVPPIPNMQSKQVSPLELPKEVGLQSIPNSNPVTEETTNPYKPRAEIGRYAPLAQGLLGLIPAPELEKYNPNTMSSGLLNPQTVDEQTMRANIDAANRANVGALSNVTGGSGAAQRAGLLGSGTNYMDATGNAFLQANQLNNQSKMVTDQFNIGNQTNVDGQNMGALNQGNMYNIQAQNALNQQMYDTRLGMAQDTLQSIGNIGKENTNMNRYDLAAMQSFGATGENGFVQSLPNLNKSNYLFGTNKKYGGVINTKITTKGLKSTLL